jgi:hypothetical protein
VVAGAFQPLQDGGVDAGVDAGTGHDLVEQLGADAARAAEGEQQPAGRQQLERQAVDVLVGARGAFGVRGGGRELRRVEHDGVEAAAALQALAQVGVDVGVDACWRRSSKPLRRTCVARALQRRRR